MDLNQKISAKYTLTDVVRSDVATRNNFAEQFTPPVEVIDNATVLATMILDRIPIVYFISSFYRCERTNKKIGGAKNSDHMLGRSADLDSQNNVNNKALFEWIKAHCEFDQLIWEHGTDQAPDWVHVSYRKNDCRNEILRASRNAQGRTIYKAI